MPKSNARKWNGTESNNQESVGFIPVGNGDGTSDWVDPATAGIGADLADAVILAPSADTRNVIQPTAAGVVGLVVQGHASQSDDIVQFKDTGGTKATYIKADGELETNRTLTIRADVGAPSSTALAATADNGTALAAISDSGSAVDARSTSGVSGFFRSDSASNANPTIVAKRTGSTATADLFNAQDENDVPMAGFESDGDVFAPNIHGIEKRQYAWQPGQITATTWTAIGAQAGVTVTATGGTTSQVDSSGGYLEHSTGTSSGDTVYVRFGGSNDMAQRRLLPDLRAEVKTGPNAADIQNVRWWPIAFASTNIHTTDTPVGHVAGFRFSTAASDTNWKAYSCDNTASTEITDTGVAVAAATAYSFRVVMSASNVKFYVNGVLVATHATRIPGSTAGVQVNASGYNLSAGTTRLCWWKRVTLAHV